MKIKIIIPFLLLFFSLTIINVFGQSQDTLNNKKRILSNISIGLKTGLNFSGMKYSEKLYNDYDKKLFARTFFGISSEYTINSKISIKPDLLFMGKGVKIEDKYNYKMKLKTMELNIPIVLNFEYSSFKPYLLVGPSFTFIRKGDIKLDEYSTEVSQANIKGSSMGVLIGIGVKYPIAIKKLEGVYLCGEVSYNHGLTDTWSKEEMSNDAIGININPYNIKGTRKHRGLEIGISLMIPLSKIVNIIKIKKRKKNFLILKKNCYTAKEIAEYIDKGLNVRRLKICLHDISFQFNKSNLQKKSKTHIDEMIILMKKRKSMKMKINGHTDNVGKDDYNLELSKKRSQSVYNYMISQGIDKKRLSYEGFGNTKPIDTNDTDEGKAKNRRVEFEIISQ